MITIVRFGEQIIVKPMSILVFPFVGVPTLLAVPIPQRNGAALEMLSAHYRTWQRLVDHPGLAGNSGNLGVFLFTTFLIIFFAVAANSMAICRINAR